MTVTVTDENGALKANAAITDDLGNAAEIKFENSYRAAAAAISLSGTKTLTGMELAADMFRFHLYEADESYAPQGPALAGVSNDASGRFAFENILFSDPGTFYYVVMEDASAAVEGMRYDETGYGVKVSVWDDGSGMLKADYTVSVVGGGEVSAITFGNSYTEPIEPPQPTDPTDSPKPAEPANTSEPADSDVSPTGDKSPIGLYIGVVILCAAALVLVLRRRNR